MAMFGNIINQIYYIYPQKEFYSFNIKCQYVFVNIFMANFQENKLYKNYQIL